MPINVSTRAYATDTASGVTPGDNSSAFPWGTSNGGPQRNGRLLSLTPPSSTVGLGATTLAQTARQSYYWGNWVIQLAAQTIPAMVWTVDAPGSESNGASNQFPPV
jgi:hypothetical protein